MSDSQVNNAALLLWCPKAAPLCAPLMRFFEQNAVEVDQFVKLADQHYNYYRLSLNLADSWTKEQDLMAALSDSGMFGDAEYSVRLFSNVPTIGIFCSEQTHVLVDVLSRSETNYFPKFSVPFIISDSEQCRKIADRHGVPFFHVAASLNAEQRRQRQLEIIRRYRADWLGLARYDALLSQQVIDSAGCSVLTVNNSFSPKLKSEKAYEVAYEQGQKLIGATTRMVEKDGVGPIVEQDVMKLGPCPNLNDIRIAGHTIERKVFVRTLRKLIEHKIIIHNNKSVIFD